MAIDYSKLFQSIGPFIKNVNDLETLNLALNARQSAIETELVTHGAYYTRFADGLSNYTEQAEQNNLGLINENIARVVTILQDDELVFKQLPISTSDLATLLPALYKDMVTNAQSINASVFVVDTSSSKTYTHANAGDVHVVAKLDGANPPLSGGYVNAHWNNATSELVVPGLVRIVCTNDDVDGREQWTIFGQLQDIPFGKDTESPQGIFTFVSATGETSLSNGSFDIWSGVNPTGWDITFTGTGDKSQETTVVLRSGSALKLTNVTANPTYVKQQVGGLTIGQRYLASVAAWVEDAGGIVAPSITITITDSTGSENYGQVSAEGTDGQWEFFNLDFYLPIGVDPTDVYMYISVGDIEAVGDIVYLDQAIISPIHYYEGVGYAMIPGVDRFSEYDKLELTHTKTSGGVIQEYFRKAHNFQLPSNNAAAETILDSVVA